MEVIEFTYHEPDTIAAACEMGQTFGASSRYLAGGTELLVDFQSGRDHAEHLISLARIPELRTIRSDGDLVRIGGLASLAQVAESPDVRRLFDPLREAVLTMAGVQIRNQGTIGGNFCRAVPCADTPPICIAGNAQLRIVGAERERTVPAEEFFIGPRKTVLEPGEILAEILIPKQPARSGARYERFSLRTGSALAVASVAARVTLDGDTIKDARIVLGAVAPIPLLATAATTAMIGKRPTSDVFERAATSAAAAARPITDLRGSETYRRDLVRQLTRRALVEASARAGNRCGGAVT